MHKLLSFLLLFSILTAPYSVNAQDEQPAGPVYIVQSGDNLTSIAVQFDITQDDLINANNITDPNQVAVGDQLIIPGLEGVKGFLITMPVAFGSTLNTLAVQNSVSKLMLTKLNHITSPAELYTGVSLIIPQQDDQPEYASEFLLSRGQSFLEFSVLSSQNPWYLSTVNLINKPITTIPNQEIFLPVTEVTNTSGLQALPLGNVEISPLPMVQGKTITFKIAAPDGVQLGGNLIEHPLHFFPDGEGSYISFQGVHALQETGVYPLQISMKMQDGSEYTQEQLVLVQEGNYGKDPVIQVKDEFIDPTITQPELDWLLTQVEPATSEKYWTDVFTSPSPYSYQDCLNSKYGNRRSYNGGPYDSFHTGVDFCGGEGVKIFAAAAGKVVFSGPLTVRGNATLIDHGWGIYSGYWHQSVSYVKTGDTVESGHLIGLIGGTGRVTGAHLHWEVWAGGVQINPLDWLEQTYP